MYTLLIGAVLATVGIGVAVDPAKPAGATLLAVAGALLAVLTVQFFWTLGGGEPVRRQVEELSRESDRVLDELAGSVRGLGDLQRLGVTRLHHQRHDVTDAMAERWRVLGSTATKIDLLGLTLYTEWLDNQTLLDILKRVANAEGGRVRILMLGTDGEAPETAWNRDGSEVPVSSLAFQSRIRQPGERPAGTLVRRSRAGRLTGLLSDAQAVVAELRQSYKPPGLEIRELRTCVPYALTVRIDGYMYVAPYRAASAGADSIVMEVYDSGEGSIFQMYDQEFKEIWVAEAPDPDTPSPDSPSQANDR